ncbi:DUF4199 domain-containing protein [Maribacter sp. 4G9]|uniref:DUF4199 domain-containing protein n=1 Tax=Maribacter sp. 4G9 TaxID=1889777 RepID=UPI000C1460D7|nr:DUF4199 domain-containing protein [Maribacter sp. 4G9]PIB37923.1 hypothetical protein BFP75_19260 [Maribacter sp. 4G9]
MKSIIVKYGLYGFILGLGLFLLGLIIIEDSNLSVAEIFGYATMIASLSFIFIGIKHYRDKINNGFISFGNAMGIGMLISGFPALGIAIADYIYTTWINPNFFKEYAEMMKAQGNSESIPEWSSGMMSLIMFLTVILLGFIITLISALILQRKN